MNKLCRKALASCLSASLAACSLIAVGPVRAATLEQDTAVAGMAVSLDNYYANSDTQEADIMDYIRFLVASAGQETASTVYTVNAVAKNDGSVIFGTNLVAEDASEKEKGLVSVMASLNVRNKPSVNSSIIGYLYSNCVVSIYETIRNDEGTWYLIGSGDVEGYVSADYVLTGDAAQASEEDLSNRYAMVIVDSARVFNSASEGADVVGEIYRDGSYKVLEIQNGFVKIVINQEFAGYVRMEDVSLYTRHASAVAITDEMVKSQLESYLIDINDAVSIFTQRMGAGDYQAAYNAITYAYELWGYYIADASNAGYEDLAAQGRSEQQKIEPLIGQAQAALNGQLPSEPTTVPERPSTEPGTQASSESPSTEPERPSTEPESPSTEPESPSTEPERPSTEPESPSTEPERPSTEPESPSTEPGTPPSSESPSTEPETPAVPESPSTEPESPSTEPETPPSSESPSTEPTSVPDSSSEVQRTIDYIVSYYSGGTKTEGEVISASELYIEVYYTDGSKDILTEGWNCDMVGMKLTAGWNTITVTYQGFSSSFELNAVRVEIPSTEPEPTVPATDPTTPSTEPEPTVPATDPTTPSTEPEPTVPVTDPTTPSTEPEPTVPVTDPTTPATEPTAPEEITTPPSNSTPLRDSLVNYALSWVGQCNYVYGGTDLRVGGGVDCSGFTMQVYSRVAGVSLPHHSMSQMNYGSAISYNDLRPGDLVFYTSPNHVAIYIGNGAIVHAKSPESGIGVDSVFFKTPIGYRTYLP